MPAPDDIEPGFGDDIEPDFGDDIEPGFRDDIEPGFGDESSSPALCRTSGGLMENRDV